MDASSTDEIGVVIYLGSRLGASPQSNGVSLSMGYFDVCFDVSRANETRYHREPSRYLGMSKSEPSFRGRHQGA